MSKSNVGEHSWAEMSEAQKTETVHRAQVTPQEMTGGLLDGSDELPEVCRDFLPHANASLEGISVPIAERGKRAEDTSLKLQPEILAKTRSANTRQGTSRHRKAKSRFGLPENFVPRTLRCGSSILLEDNVYLLPDGREFVPQHPTGTLGTPGHLYALLTLEQYDRARRGSVYVRTDGRIFDYGVDLCDPAHEMFDTGFTINDLERTGRYVSRSDQKQTDEAKHRRAGRDYTRNNLKTCG